MLLRKQHLPHSLLPLLQRHLLFVLPSGLITQPLLSKHIKPNLHLLQKTSPSKLPNSLLNQLSKKRKHLRRVVLKKYHCCHSKPKSDRKSRGNLQWQLHNIIIVVIAKRAGLCRFSEIASSLVLTVLIALAVQRSKIAQQLLKVFYSTALQLT